MSVDIAGLRALIAQLGSSPWLLERGSVGNGPGGRPWPRDYINLVRYDRRFQVPGEPEAAFIAHARTALPAALDEIERLQAEVDAHEGEYGDLRAKLSAAEAEVDRLRDRDRAKAVIHPAALGDAGQGTDSAGETEETT